MGGYTSNAVLSFCIGVVADTSPHGGKADALISFFVSLTSYGRVRIILLAAGVFRLQFCSVKKLMNIKVIISYIFLIIFVSGCSDDTGIPSPSGDSLFAGLWSIRLEGCTESEDMIVSADGSFSAVLVFYDDNGSYDYTLNGLIDPYGSMGADIICSSSIIGSLWGTFEPDSGHGSWSTGTKSGTWIAGWKGILK